MLSSTIAAKNTNTPVTDERRTRKFRIALGILVPVLVLYIILSLYLYFRRRNRQKAKAGNSCRVPATSNDSVATQGAQGPEALDKSVA